MRRIKVEKLEETGYSGLIRVVGERSGGERVQVGYLLFKEGELAEGALETEESSLADEEALEAVRGEEYWGVFEPPLEEATGSADADLLEEAAEGDALRRLDEELG